ncbi:TOTE conflict system archaeo-eukaryotic primase domain-containing protein [Streptomyces pseudoechinosporeus]
MRPACDSDFAADGASLALRDQVWRVVRRRQDVYARRWASAKSGRSGWSPAEHNPFGKTKAETDRVFWPLTDETVYRHLDPTRQGREHSTDCAQGVGTPDRRPRLFVRTDQPCCAGSQRSR